MADDTDIKSHVATYSGMLSLLKWGGIASIILAFIVILLIK